MIFASVTHHVPNSVAAGHDGKRYWAPQCIFKLGYRIKYVCLFLQSVVKCMRSLLHCMIRQANKLEHFKVTCLCNSAFTWASNRISF